MRDTGLRLTKNSFLNLDRFPAVKKADARGTQALGFIFSMGVAASFVLLILGVVYLRM